MLLSFDAEERNMNGDIVGRDDVFAASSDRRDKMEPSCYINGQ